MSDRLDRLAYAVSTLGGMGDRLPAPGTTAGSLAATGLWWMMCWMVEGTAARVAISAAAIAVVLVAGTWASGVEGRRRGITDPQAVVIDEVAGQWLCLVLASPFLEARSAAQIGLIGGLGFVFFRVFDVAKPWPLGRLEDLPGGIGVMADDLGAGVFAACCVVATALLIGWKTSVVFW